MTKTLLAPRPAPLTRRMWVWARRGKTAFLVEPRRMTKALAGLDPAVRARLMARLRANTAALTAKT